MHTELSLTVTNTGEAAGQDIPVLIVTSGGGSRDDGSISRLASGETATLAIAQPREPGEHSITFSVGGAEHTATVSVLATDLTLELVDYAVAGDGSMAFQARVTNAGGLAAENVAVSATWTARPGDDDGVDGRAERVAAIERVPPGASETTTLLLPIPTGAYDLTLSAETSSLEAATDDNAAKAAVEVEYVDLTLSVETARITGYEHDGDGIVEIPLRVTNEGVSPSGSLTVGALCGSAPPACSTSTTLGSLPVGGSINAALTLVLPQGGTLVTVYAGAPDNGYRWGERNAIHDAILVPDKPAVALMLDATADVLGYWSDGTAEVELSFSLSSDGYRPIEDALTIAVTCHRDGGEAISKCGGAVDSLTLQDGFGPAERVTRLRVPMGVDLHAALPDGAAESNAFNVPERILGVDRYIWECFSDRPDRPRDDERLEGCGGWISQTVQKWSLNRPVRVWTTGDSDYLSVLNTLLKETPSLLRLRFELVGSKEEADVEAYVGVPRSTSFELGWGEVCANANGCADWSIDAGVVKHGRIGVWHRGDLRDIYESVKGDIYHELLHVMVPIGHRHTLDALMGGKGRLSIVDRALIRLHQHPLIRPNMTMREVEELIVLDDELLDAQSPNAYEMVRRAVAALQEAGSARFSLRGRWYGDSCGHPEFGWADYEIGAIGESRSGLTRLRDDANHYLIVGGSNYWSESRGQWEKIEFRDIFAATAWNHRYTSPFAALTPILLFADADTLKVAERANGHIRVTAAPIESTITSGLVKAISLVLHEDTYQIAAYRLTLRFPPGSCRLSIEAKDSEYGIEIPIPDEIAAAG